MKITVPLGAKTITVDLSAPADLSIALRGGPDNLTAWYSPPPSFKAVEQEGFIGDVKRGGSVNFRDIFFNPHAHGTHTECVGHISDRDENISDALKEFYFWAKVITVKPARLENGDEVITANQLAEVLKDTRVEALIIRTLPNDAGKIHRQYSHTNPPYISHEAVTLMVNSGIRHLLTDLPSVDKEKDGGALLAHKAFWEYPAKKETGRTITEFIYVPDSVADGIYWMNLQVANFLNDAAPSRPVIYPIVS